MATGHRVRLIALSVGGNDIGFQDVIIACTKEFLKPGSGHSCAAAQQEAVEGRFARMREEVAKAVRSIRAVMRGTGAQDGSYRLVLQSYPSPLPDAARDRLPGPGVTRFTVGGCPFSDTDLDWATTPGPRDDRRTRPGRHRGAHRVSSTCPRLPGPGGLRHRHPAGHRHRAARPATSEWVRFLVTGTHPGRAPGEPAPGLLRQLALGRCLALAADRPEPEGHFRCTDTPGSGPEAMAVALE
ncbi:hypothetical protein [Streptacidiphilus sp. P02-A3a]|uniref:hypothetical protein n=1 Tax=Streptacidiphilus sp. P02-A3a TaxID=2704468 RepID=UPI0015F8524B|nr:hypothetical protein [Streptacidiphilus sp. P02-A3a]QMU70344.1 hypothetical protein GXP74_21145 [Streptacidiphilus sp. P02-A3a]